MSAAKQLYELQEIDLELDQNSQALEGVEKQLGEKSALLRAQSELESEELQLAQLESKEQGAEWEAEDIRTKVADVEKKLYGGSIRNLRELMGLEQEVKQLKAKLEEKEERLLDVMSQVEMIQQRVSRKKEELKLLEEDFLKQQQRLTGEKAELTRSRQEMEERRRRVAAGIDPQSLELYHELRTGRGMAVARVEEGKCQGCRLTLPTSELRRARGGELVKRSSCGRILYLA